MLPDGGGPGDGGYVLVHPNGGGVVVVGVDAVLHVQHPPQVIGDAHGADAAR